MDSIILDATPSLARFCYSLGSLLGVILGLTYFIYLSALPKPLPGIPYSDRAAKSVFGSLPEIQEHVKVHGNLLRWFFQQNTRFNSPIVQAWIAPFAKPVVLLSDAQETRDILMRRTKEFDRSPYVSRVFESSLPQHHITMKSAALHFKGNKELVRDLMSPGFLEEASASQIHGKAMTLIELWSLKAELAQGVPFNAQPDLNDTTLDIINAAAFAFDDDRSATRHQLNYLKSHQDSTQLKIAANESIEFPRLAQMADLAAFIEVTEFIGKQISSLLPKVTYWYNIVTNRHLRRSIARKDQVIINEIKTSLDRFKRGDEGQFSAVDQILRRERTVARKEERSPDFFSRRILDELFGYLVAGHDTSLTAQLWTVQYMAQQQQVQQTLRSVLREGYPIALIQHRQPSAAEILKTDLPYLDAVIEECLRVSAPIRLVSREATVDTVVLGRRIPKGTTIFFSGECPSFKSAAIHVDDLMRSATSLEKPMALWNPDTAHLFDPERWLRKDDDGVVFDSTLGPTLAFSLGPRGCFGRKLALMEMKMLLVLLIWNFHFEKLEGSLAATTEIEGFTTTPSQCYVELKKIIPTPGFPPTRPICRAEKCNRRHSPYRPTQ